MKLILIFNRCERTRRFKNRIFTSIFTLLFLTDLNAQLSDQRKFQLDSITSTIPLSIRKNFEKVHAYLDAQGKTDEEKVWMFYGYMATYFKYDKKRFWGYKLECHTPEYTTYLSKGICGDFSKVFAEFCRKSKIPCFEVHGKTPRNLLYWIRGVIHLHFGKLTHAWNVVKINGTWQLMDPTWTDIKSTTKVSYYDPTQKMERVIVVKSADRSYYNPTPEFMLKTHVPIHPAFLLMPDIPSFRTALKPKSKQVIYAKDYQFAEKLDSIYAKKLPQINRLCDRESFQYSEESTCMGFYYYELDAALAKRSKYNPPCVEDYDRLVKFLQELTKSVENEMGTVGGIEYLQCLEKLTLARDKLLIKMNRSNLQTK